MPKRAVPKSPAEPPRIESCCGTDCCGGDAGCCGLPAPGCCEVEAVVSVDARGQMVLPKVVREKAGFTEDQKLAVVSWRRGSEVCCVTLVKADGLADAVRHAYGPIVTELLRGK